MTRLVFVAGAPKGEVYYKRSRWRWLRNNGATQVFPRSMQLEEIGVSIARDCLKAPEEVVFKRARAALHAGEGGE